jgi:ubiquinone/menaquinone biosynthesis C-methylase UbiE
MQSRPLFDFLAPFYAKIIPTFFDRLSVRASQRVRAGAPASIIEIGVGTGQFLAEVAGRKASSIVGVDTSRRMLGRARKSVEGTKGKAGLVQSDGQKLPFAGGSFEGVVSLLFLGVLEDDEIRDALREMTRILAPGGRIVIGTLKFTNPVFEKLWMTAYHVLPDVVGGLRPIDLDAHLDDLGLRIVKEEEIEEFAGVRMLTLMKVVG